ncbi:hypothetical protein SAMN02745127_02482 [Oceanospirillum multiglobuliferum]|uniref:Prepilin-type N-terminal cleavage/methylation domain-containing protein n=1 Tax=Oceanospirillum multiglobuliferum TaxID=64969 RepID=A0A1T4RMQ3_9GAMM|nr:hypothetical protein [Oceanospirillum multiglobuliferum]OPX54771.1 hypothetical protein BTE48_12770 [Oceanospirillum multiglobuliferum]SKA17264.1 hypothetical protein SAMN02745127_02482 [Oceanospirillum multiglobuliferum]
MIKHSQQSGMTLIEILVIVLVVSVGMITTAKFQADLLHTGSATKARTQALALAQQEIENLRINHDTAANGTEDDVAGVNAEYDRSWTVTGFAGVAGAQQYQSSITWTDSQNRTQNLQLSAVLYPDNMLSATDSERVTAGKCIFTPTNCQTTPEPEPDPTPPTTVVEVDIDNEQEISIGTPLTGLDIAKDNLKALGKKASYLTGRDYIDKLNGSASLNGTSGDDKLLVTGKANGSLSLNMGAGDDTVQINDSLTGSASINLGAGDDLLMVAEIKGAASVTGGSGIDTICFSNWSSLSGKAFAISGVEILLFNDGSHQFLNGYSTDASNLPYGCGSGGVADLVYRYPVSIALAFPTEESANRDGQAIVTNNTNNITLLEEGSLLVFYSGITYHLYLNTITAEPGTGDYLGKFVKNVHFTLESPTKILAKDQIQGCATWTGTDYSELEISIQDTACN